MQILAVQSLAPCGAVEEKNARIGFNTPIRQRTFFGIRTLVETDTLLIVGTVVQIRNLTGIAPSLNAIEQRIETLRSPGLQTLVSNSLQQPARIDRDILIIGPHGCGIIYAPMNKETVAIRRSHLIEKSRYTMKHEVLKVLEKASVCRCYLNLSIGCKHHEYISRMTGPFGLNPRAVFHIVHGLEN